MALWQFLVLTFAWFAPCTAQDTAWAQAAKWVQSHGGYVHPALHGNMTMHGGHELRGVTTSQALGAQTALLSIPDRLWLTINTFPHLRDVNLTLFGQCSFPGRVDGHAMLKFAAGVAQEVAKGNESFFAPIVQNYPKVDDYRTYYPRYMNARTMNDFQDLPLVHIVRNQQEQDEHLRKCFEKWRNAPQSAIFNLTWNHMLAAMAQIRTRVYGTRNGTVLIPMADLLNTDRDVRVNTAYKFTRSRVSLYGMSTTLNMSKGDEVYDAYCPTCSNDHLLAVWGVYLEDNTRSVHKKHMPSLVFCNHAHRNHTLKQGSHDPAQKSLRHIAESMLDIESWSLNLREVDEMCKCPGGPLPVPKTPAEAMETLSRCYSDDFQAKQPNRSDPSKGIRPFAEAVHKMSKKFEKVAKRAMNWNQNGTWNDHTRRSTYTELKRALRAHVGSAWNMQCEIRRWKAPRCKPEAVMNSDQGPIRCNLARLAWEYCSSTWGHKEAPSDRPPSVASSLLEEHTGHSPAFSFAELAKMYDRSARHSLHPDLITASSNGHTSVTDLPAVAPQPTNSQLVRVNQHADFIQLSEVDAVVQHAPKKSEASIVRRPLMRTAVS